MHRGASIVGDDCWLVSADGVTNRYPILSVFFFHMVKNCLADVAVPPRIEAALVDEDSLRLVVRTSALNRCSGLPE